MIREEKEFLAYLGLMLVLAFLSFVAAWWVA